MRSDGAFGAAEDAGAVQMRMQWQCMAGFLATQCGGRGLQIGVLQTVDSAMQLSIAGC